MDNPRSLLRFVRAVVVSLALGTVGVAYAEGEDAPRAVAGVGVAVPVLTHTLYGPGVLVQAGAELPLGDGDAQRLRILGRWIGLATTGARADLGMVEAAWRIYPRGKRLRFELGTGVLFEIERLEMNLPGRSLDESNTRAGMPASVAFGFGLGRRIELEVGYQQLLFFGDQPRTAGIAHASIGGRL